MKKRNKSTLTILTLIVSLFLTIGISAQQDTTGTQGGPPVIATQEQDDVQDDVTGTMPPSQFDTLTGELGAMQDLFSGGGSQPVSFDAETAVQRGFSPQAVKLAQEMAAYTNDLLQTALAEVSASNEGETNVNAALASVDITELDVSAKKYPLLQSYLGAGDARVDAAEKLDATPEADAPDLLAQDESLIPTFSIPGLSELVCGFIGHPKPSHAAPRYTVRGIGDPVSYLHWYGFHSTPGFAGGGWTRPQTYKPLLCGYHTYRDQAIITGPHSASFQIYAGYSPDGEPNPEVWRSGPWPYSIWPVYVRWWHNHF